MKNCNMKVIPVDHKMNWSIGKNVVLNFRKLLLISVGKKYNNIKLQLFLFNL